MQRTRRTQRHDDEPDHDAAHIAQFGDDLGRGPGHQEIGGEEAELGEHHLGVIEGEQGFEFGHQYIIERRGKAPGKEQRGNERRHPGGRALHGLAHSAVLRRLVVYCLIDEWR